MNVDSATGLPETPEATIGWVVPSLRLQIEHHLEAAAAETSSTDQILHLAIAAGIGLAMATLEDRDDAEAYEIRNHPLNTAQIAALRQQQVM